MCDVSLLNRKLPDTIQSELIEFENCWIIFSCADGMQKLQ